MKNLKFKGHSVVTIHEEANAIRRGRKEQPMGFGFYSLLVEHVTGRANHEIVDAALKKLGVDEVPKAAPPKLAEARA